MLARQFCTNGATHCGVKSLMCIPLPTFLSVLVLFVDLVMKERAAFSTSKYPRAYLEAGKSPVISSTNLKIVPARASIDKSLREN